MNKIIQKNLSIDELLKNEPREPFSINLNIESDKGTTEELFTIIKNIFTKGLLILNGNESSDILNINDIDYKNFDIMKRHMLSMGIDVKLKIYSPETRDYLLRNLLYDLKQVKNIDIKVLVDWKTDIINEVNVNLKLVNNDKSILKIFKKIINNHFEANHFLNLSKEESLRDFPIFINNGKNITVVYFDYAKRSSIEYIYKYVLNPHL